MKISLRSSKAFPFIRQRDLTECGTTCLAMIFKHHGLYNIQHTLRGLASMTREGTSLLTLSEIAETFGFTTQGYRLNFDLLSKIHLPCIAHYDGNHFVVIYKSAKDAVYISNPAYGNDKLSRSEFASKWNGVVLTLEPTESVFKHKNLEELVQNQRDSEKTVFRKHYAALITPFRQVLFEILAVSFILQLLGLALPFFAQGIVDRVLVYQDKKLLFGILLSMVAIFLAQVVLIYVRNILLAQFKVNFELSFFSNFFNYFIHLKQSYFDSHRREDFINRFQENLRIRRILSPAIVQSFIDLVLVLNLIFVLFLYNVTLASVALGFVLLMLITTILATPKLRRLEDKIFYDNLETMRSFLDTLLGMQTVKLLRLEKLLFWDWRRIYTKALNRVLASEKLYARLQSILRGIFLISQITVYWIGAEKAFRGELSIGQYIAFIGIFTVIMTSLNSIVTLWSMATEVSISYSRLNDILMTPPERMDLLEQRCDLGSFDRIEIRNLSFRYSEGSEKYALKDINLTIARGEQLAVVGRNGSGKTTLSKLLTKLYKEYSGEILVNGIELEHIHPHTLRKRITLLPQAPYLFSGTIRENISYGNPEASMAEIIEAAKLADVHQVIASLYLGYNHKVSEYSNVFSGGEKLKLAIARLFLSNPDVIILDEASSALDVQTEAVIMRNLKEHFKGKTIISIAHRLHTVKTADRIVVLDEGRIAEIGTHEELINGKGIYHQFVQTYLDV